MFIPGSFYSQLLLSTSEQEKKIKCSVPTVWVVKHTIEDISIAHEPS